MKKTYKAPKYKTIDLSGEKMVAQSFGVNDTYNEEEQLVKENVSSRMNLWDDEW